MTYGAYQKFVKILSKGFSHKVLWQYCCVNHACFQESNHSIINTGEACCSRASMALASSGCFMPLWSDGPEGLWQEQAHTSSVCIQDRQSLEQLSDRLFFKNLGTHKGGYTISFQSQNLAWTSNQSVEHCPAIMVEWWCKKKKVFKK